MGSRACTEHRCDSVQQKKTSKGSTGPVNGRCGNNSIVEYWKSSNDSSFSFPDIITRSGGSKHPTCVQHGGLNKFEGWTIGQSNCSGHRNGKGTDITAINNETIIYGGNNSFVGLLYSQINNELNARQQHNIYRNLTNITVPHSNSIIDIPDLNDAIDTINNYAKVADTDVTNLSTKKVVIGNLVKKSDFNDLKSDFNSKIVSECICYSDCNGYSVCYCYGNCNYY